MLSACRWRARPVYTGVHRCTCAKDGLQLAFPRNIIYIKITSRHKKLAHRCTTLPGIFSPLLACPALPPCRWLRRPGRCKRRRQHRHLLLLLPQGSTAIPHGRHAAGMLLDPLIQNTISSRSASAARREQHLRQCQTGRREVEEALHRQRSTAGLSNWGRQAQVAHLVAAPMVHPQWQHQGAGINVTTTRHSAGRSRQAASAAAAKSGGSAPCAACWQVQATPYNCCHSRPGGFRKGRAAVSSGARRCGSCRAAGAGRAGPATAAEVEGTEVACVTVAAAAVAASCLHCYCTQWARYCR